jgi:hypothetical protein
LLGDGDQRSSRGLHSTPLRERRTAIVGRDQSRVMASEDSEEACGEKSEDRLWSMGTSGKQLHHFGQAPRGVCVNGGSIASLWEGEESSL